MPTLPAAGLDLPGAVGAYASTPDVAVLDITGDIDIRAHLTMDDWTPAVQTWVVSKADASGVDRSYALVVETNGRLNLTWSANGSTLLSEQSSELAPFVNGKPGWIRATLDVDNGAADAVVTFYVSTNGTTWSQLGTTQLVGATTSIFAGGDNLQVGARSEGATNNLDGRVFSIEVRNGIDGAAVANPDFGAQTPGATSFTDAAGRVWTVDGSASIVAGGITPSLNGEIWLKSIRYPFLNRPVNVSTQDAIERASRTGVFPVKGRSTPIAVSDLRGSHEFLAELRTDTYIEARNFDLILAVGDVFFLHTPPDCPRATGGYITIGRSTQRTLTRGGKSTRRILELPCTVVTPPGPDVVGTTLTWGTVFNLYGSWEALLAANATWAALLATVGDPGDLVTL